MTNSINGRIRAERMKTGLTYQEFAKKIKVDPSTMNRWETGKSNLRANSLILLSEAFGVTIDYLLRGTGDKTYVGVFSFGGIISDVQTYDTLEEGIEKMKILCVENRFDPEVDDARIFELGNKDGAVHSFDHEEEMEETK